MLLSGHFAGARRVVRIDVVASPRDEVAMSHAGLLRWGLVPWTRQQRVRPSARPSPAGDQASSLSLAMCLTTILTTIWVCPPQYV
jgi:hypothetical protein